MWKYSFSKGCKVPVEFHLFDPLCIAGAPFRRRQVRPAHVTRDEVLALVSQHAKKRVVGLDDLTSEIDDENSDDVGVDQAPDLRFPFLKIAIETRVFQRDRRLCRQQFQDRDPSRCERV